MGGGGGLYGAAVTSSLNGGVGGIVVEWFYE
jgi:hypothetical protein